MGRSKEMGKPVDELNPAELAREHHRCKSLLQAYGPKSPAGKGLAKRLHEIERRIAWEERESN
jgi:hypothetical protein